MAITMTLLVRLRSRVQPSKLSCQISLPHSPAPQASGRAVTYAGESPKRAHSSFTQRPAFSRINLRRTFATGYRGDPGSSSNSARTAIWAIIGVNTAVFGMWQYSTLLEDRKLVAFMQRHFTCSMMNLREGRYYTLVTCAFSHSMLLHFAFNMIALNAFGNVISLVPGVGGVHVLSLCIGSAIAGSLGWLYHNNNRQLNPSSRQGVPDTMWRRQSAFSLGASGMVMGAGTAATCLMPFAPMMILPIPFAIPLWAITLLYFGLDAYQLNSPGSVGHAAHLGGAVYGLAYYALYLRRHGGVYQIARRAFRR